VGTAVRVGAVAGRSGCGFHLEHQSKPLQPSLYPNHCLLYRKQWFWRRKKKYTILKRWCSIDKVWRMQNLLRPVYE